MSDIILHTEQLTKRFSRRVLAVNELNLEVKRGQVFGILGPNGSGKTTTLGMILGVTSKTKGNYSWFEKGDHYTLRKNIGAILEQPNFYPFLSAYQNMVVHSKIKEIKKPGIDELLKLVGLYDRRHDPFKTYSLGMKQRVAIASALLADPEVLIFDEPTNGLDPMGIVEIRKMILDIRDMDKTIILASHLLDEVQKVCSDFAVLQKGKMIYAGSVAEALYNTKSLMIAADNPEVLWTSIQTCPGIKNAERVHDSVKAELKDDWSSSAVNKYLIERGVEVSHLQQKKSSLEEKFLEVLKENETNPIAPAQR